jgi:hypothetical protein
MTQGTHERNGFIEIRRNGLKMIAEDQADPIKDFNV